MTATDYGQIRQHGAMEGTNPPVDLDAVRMYRLGRIREQLRRFDYAGVLLYDQLNSRYATDATNMQVWCSHNEARYTFVPTQGPWSCSNTALTGTCPKACLVLMRCGQQRPGTTLQLAPGFTRRSNCGQRK